LGVDGESITLIPLQSEFLEIVKRHLYLRENILSMPVDLDQALLRAS
jgi:hypothetical protein